MDLLGDDSVFTTQCLSHGVRSVLFARALRTWKSGRYFLAQCLPCQERTSEEVSYGSSGKEFTHFLREGQLWLLTRWRGLLCFRSAALSASVHPDFEAQVEGILGV